MHIYHIIGSICIKFHLDIFENCGRSLRYTHSQNGNTCMIMSKKYLNSGNPHQNVSYTSIGFVCSKFYLDELKTVDDWHMTFTNRPNAWSTVSWLQNIPPVISLVGGITTLIHYVKIELWLTWVWTHSRNEKQKIKLNCCFIFSTCL